MGLTSTVDQSSSSVSSAQQRAPQVFERWASRDERYGDTRQRSTWLGTLAALAAPLCARQQSWSRARRSHCTVQWKWLNTRLGEWTKPPLSSHSRKSIEEACRPIVALLAAAIAGDLDLQSTMVERLASERDYPAAGAIAVLRAGIPHGAAMLGLGSLHADWTRALTALGASPPRAPEDWSITTKLGCRCGLCVRLGQFLRAADQPPRRGRVATSTARSRVTSFRSPMSRGGSVGPTRSCGPRPGRWSRATLLGLAARKREGVQLDGAREATPTARR